MSKQALLIVDHGSIRNEANEMLKDVAAAIKMLVPGTPVHFAHMELCEPTIEQGFAKCVQDGASEVIVHPYMLSPGRHATSDIPRMTAEAAAKYPGVKFRVTECLGVDRKIAELVLDRAGISVAQNA
jgi:sirohydrochlorin ferrochelatase